MTDWDQVWDERFVSRWREMMSASATAHVFFEPQMVRWWVQQFRREYNGQPRFGLARHAGGTEALYPLMQFGGSWKCGWRRWLGPVGFEGFDYLDPIFAGPVDPSALRSYWRQLLGEIVSRFGRSCGPIRLLRVQEAQADEQAGFRHHCSALQIPLGDATCAWDALPSGGHLKRDIRRRIRRLEETAPVSLRVFGPDEADAAKAEIPALRRALGARWATAAGSGGYFENLIDACLGEGYLHFSCLNWGDRAISWHMGFLHGGRFYYYKPAFEQGLAPFSPGKVHIAMLLNWLLPGKASVFDFLRGDEAYKLDWTRDGQSVQSLEIAAQTRWLRLRQWATAPIPRALSAYRDIRKRVRRATVC